MFKLLLANDGSENAMRAVSYRIKRASIAKDQHQYPSERAVSTTRHRCHLC